MDGLKKRAEEIKANRKEMAELRASLEEAKSAGTTEEAKREGGRSSASASAIAFAVIGCGCVSSILAGVYADLVGRTTICLVSCTLSALVSIVLGGLVENTYVVMCLGVVWGLSIIADS